MAEPTPEYERHLETLAAACRTINMLPLTHMAMQNETLQTIAPIFDPTAYQRGGWQNLHDQRRIIDAALDLQHACAQIAEKHTRG